MGNIIENLNRTEFSNSNKSVDLAKKEVGDGVECS